MTQFRNSTDLDSATNFRSESDLYKFKDRLSNESYKRLLEQRDKIFLRMGHNIRNKDRSVSCQNVWEKKPVDFSRKLYDPHPPKRNSKAAIRPWEYDRYLRAPEDENIFWEPEESTKSIGERLLEESLLIANDQYNSSENLKFDFETEFCVVTPTEAKIEACKSSREGLGQYQQPRDHDHRGLKQMYGVPKFSTNNNKDPSNIKFLSQNLDQINGLSDGTCLREFDDDNQMGDLVRKKDLRYNPKLILPRLEFPNKYNAYTRFKSTNDADDAYWERLIPALNKEWKKNK